MPSDYLKPCPHKPNCVSSLSEETAHAVEPLRYAGDWLVAKQSLLQLIEGIPRTAIVENTGEYLHAIFKSKLFGFVDDVEFLFDDTEKLVHIRSASRLGYFDFGANRQRVEMLRKRWRL